MPPVSASALWKPTPIRATSATKTPSKQDWNSHGLTLPFEIGSYHDRLEAAALMKRAPDCRGWSIARSKNLTTKIKPASDGALSCTQKKKRPQAGSPGTVLGKPMEPASGSRPPAQGSTLRVIVVSKKEAPAQCRGFSPLLPHLRRANLIAQGNG